MKLSTFTKGVVFGFVALIGFVVAPSLSSAAEIYVGGTASSTPDGTVENPFATIQEGVTAASDGDTVIVSGNHIVTTTVSLNKDITLQSNSASIDTTGSNQVFNITAAGVTIDGFNFNKADSMDQNLVGIQANDVTISNNTFVGLFNIGDSQVTRAMAVSPGVTNVTISDNHITHLRQPAYLDNSSGTVSNNYVSDTKGWVVSSDAGITFTDNTFGTNVFDIAVIPGPTNNYDAVQLATDNNNAAVENQFGGTPVLATVYVDDSAAPAGNGTAAAPYQTIAEAVTRVANGGTIQVADGTYSPVTITKGLILKGTNATFTSGDPAISISTTTEVTIDGFTFDGTGRPISTVDGGNVVIKNNIFQNTVGNATLYFSNLGTFTFTGNTLTNISPANDEGIFLAGNWNGTTGTVVTITGNTFQNSTMTGMNLSNVTGTISGNTFSHISYYGILLANNTSGISVTNNTFDTIAQQDSGVPTYGAGVRFYTPSLTGSVDISNNHFLNSYIGIAVRDAASDVSGQISGTGNTFEGNNFAVFHNGLGTLDFSNNYWGFSTGPAVGAISGSSSASVITSPFCTNASCTPEAPVVPVVTPVQQGGHRSPIATSVANTGTPAAAPGRVLGASTVSLTLTANIGRGASSETVKSLQEKLRAEGFFTFPTSTGFFGPITFAAVKAYQTAHGIPATGFVGPLTRAALSN